MVLLAAGVWMSHAPLEPAGATSGGASVFADLKPALGDIEEIRLSKGDGSRTTLQQGADGWTVVERQYPGRRARACASSRWLSPASRSSNARPAIRLTTRSSASKRRTRRPPASTLVEVVAGKKTWSLIVGKGADGRAVYVRKPAEAASALAQPLITADPDQKRWIDRLLADLPGAERARHLGQARERARLSTDARGSRRHRSRR